MIGKLMRKILDKGFTLRTEGGARRQPVGRVLGRPIVFRLMTLTLTAAVLTNINTTPSKADMNLKLYAYNLLTWREFQCFNWLIHYESRWNPQARNGSHYGLGQMRSTWYRDLSPQAQIKASIKYIHHRYKDSCDALTHFERKGWH
jgi:hypothetical protein